MLFAVIAGLLVTTAESGASVPNSAPVTPPALFSPDRVIVEWAAGASPTERRAARQGADVDFSRDLGDRRFQLVETEPRQTPREAVRELEADPAVVLAERDGYDTLIPATGSNTRTWPTSPGPTRGRRSTAPTTTATG